MRSAALYSHIV